MKIVIKALDNDINIIKNVQKFLFIQIKNEFGYDYVPEWHQDIVDIQNFYINNERNNIFVAFNESDEIISTIGIRAYDKDFEEFRGVYSNEKTASIWRLFVDRRYRRCGLASKMFNVAETFAHDCGYSEIYLHTHKTLDGAIEFWTKMGFVVALDSNDDLQTVHMDKEIKGLEINSVRSVFTYAVEF